MTDYKKLVKALRCGEYKPECGSSDCPYWSCLGCMDRQLMEDAAAAIEELQVDNAELESCVRTLTEQRDYWKDKNEELQQIADHYEQTARDYWKEACEYKAQLPKLGKWIRVQEVDIPGEIHPVAFKCMCSMCRNEYLFPRIPRYCPDCGSMNTAKMEVQE